MTRRSDRLTDPKPDFAGTQAHPNRFTEPAMRNCDHQ